MFPAFTRLLYALVFCCIVKAMPLGTIKQVFGVNQSYLGMW